MEVLPTDQQIIDAVKGYLVDVDLLEVSKKSLRKTLEIKFGCDLIQRKELINKSLDDFLETLNPKEDTTELQEKPNDPSSLENGQQEMEEETIVDEIPIKKEKQKRKGGGGGFAEVQLSDELYEMFGEVIMKRTEVTKRMWAYIKEKGLQNPSNRREILADETLLKVFKRKKFDMFQMTKMLSNMVKSTSLLQDGNSFKDSDDEEKSDSDRSDGGDDDEEGEEGGTRSRARAKDSSQTRKRKSSRISVVEKKKKPAKKAKPSKKSDSIKDASEARKRQRVAEEGEGVGVRGGSFNMPMKLSSGLSALLHAEEMSRPQVVKNMWTYIREHNLQNPKDKREIMLDKALKQLFQTDKCTMFTLNKHLTEHLQKI